MGGTTKWGFINKVGQVAIGFRFDHAYQFREGLAIIRLDKLAGYISTQGDVVIAPQFGDESQNFGEGLASVQFASGKVGFINKQGDVAIAPRFDSASSFQDGYALVKVNKKFGYIDRQGEFIIEAQFIHAADGFQEGLVYVADEDGDWWFLNAVGERVLGPFEHAGNFSDGTARIGKSDNFTLLNRAGEAIRIANAQWLSDYSSSQRRQFTRCTRSGIRCGYIDPAGREAIPPQFDEGSTFFENLAAVKVKNRWGYINTAGALVIEPQFEEAQAFHDGWACVQQNGKCFYIDRAGEAVLRTDFPVYFGFSDGLTPVYVE